MSEKRANDTQEEKSNKVAKKSEYETSPDFKLLLVNNPVESLAYQKKDGVLFVVERTDKVTDVFKGLVEHNFQSAPVLQKTKHKWYGFIDIVDIVSYFIHNFSEKELSEHGIEQLIKKKQEFSEKKVNDVIEHPSARKVTFHAVTTGYSLYSAIEALAREHSLHRVAIVDSSRNLKSVLTQSQVIEFLYKNASHLGSIKDKPLKNVVGVIKPVVCIKETDKAIEGFSAMKKESVTGIAVVNDKGELTGNLSLKDIKAIRTQAELFKRLYQTAHNFIVHLREEVYVHRQERPRTKQYVEESNTLFDAIETLVEHHIHRVYIVDHEKKPIGVVSLRDILLEIISN